MEGGKVMKGRLIFKTVFVIILTFILIGLIFIIYDKAGTAAHIYNPLLVSDYVIIDESKDCSGEEELIYEDSKYKYYLPCPSSYDISLEWTDGDTDLLKNALNNKKVTIESLEDHGLKVIKHEK